MLRVERTLREELEGQLNELLGGGLAAALKDTEEEFNASCLAGQGSVACLVLVAGPVDPAKHSATDYEIT